MKNLLISFISFVLIQQSCGGGSSASGELVSDKAIAMDQAPIDVPSQTDAPVQAVSDRKIIREGSLNFQVDNLQETRNWLEKAIQDNQGYISAESANNYETRVEHSVTVRIPSNNFDRFLFEVQQKASRIEFKNISANDVTAEFIDVSARLKTKKELEERYRGLLARANNVEEILAIEKQIGDLRSEIESIEGRLKYLQDRTSMSTLTLTYYTSMSRVVSFGEKFKNGFVNGWQNLIWFFVGLVNIWPFVLLTVLFILLIRRWRQRMRKKSQEKI